MGSGRGAAQVEANKAIDEDEAAVALLSPVLVGVGALIDEDDDDIVAAAAGTAGASKGMVSSIAPPPTVRSSAYDASADDESFTSAECAITCGAPRSVSGACVHTISS